MIEAIERKENGSLNSPLHLTAYFFNPFYLYGDIMAQEHTSARFAFLHNLDLFYSNPNIQDVVAVSEFQKHMHRNGLMRSTIAKRHWQGFNGTNNFDPGNQL